ncbi:hypothetical protein BD310DRAFT_251385 [Dichomitus squalens]|uniref:Uncharacterized protein n=1 Tax=Dichomitus squalens TaxID=114155 RepID=A0A4Q9Q178_9APHY|nr:hypothetical protein BD310DRAFT_251385 [Dichomitus squalens]
MDSVPDCEPTGGISAGDGSECGPQPIADRTSFVIVVTARPSSASLAITQPLSAHTYINNIPTWFPCFLLGGRIPSMRIRISWSGRTSVCPHTTPVAREAAYHAFATGAVYSRRPRQGRVRAAQNIVRHGLEAFGGSTRTSDLPPLGQQILGSASHIPTHHVPPNCAAAPLGYRERCKIQRPRRERPSRDRLHTVRQRSPDAWLGESARNSGLAFRTVKETYALTNRSQPRERKTPSVQALETRSGRLR